MLNRMPARRDSMMEAVAGVLREVSEEAIEPRFDALQEADVRLKSPGEVVTIADEEAERHLKRRLGELLPGAAFVGEEEFSGGAGLAEAVRGDRFWLVDPLDGTANFVSGSPRWAVMVALVQGGVTSAAWIWQPRARVMYLAEVGAGATRNDVPIARQPPSPLAGGLRGSVLTRFLDPPTAAHVEANRDHFDAVGPGSGSAGIDYPMVADGEQDFVMFWRTLPWDHVPGALLVSESGGWVRRLNGDPYSPRQPGAGLLVAATPATWHVVRDTLLGGWRSGDGTEGGT